MMEIYIIKNEYLNLFVVAGWWANRPANLNLCLLIKSHSDEIFVAPDARLTGPGREVRGDNKTNT